MNRIVCYNSDYIEYIMFNIVFKDISMKTS